MNDLILTGPISYQEIDELNLQLEGAQVLHVRTKGFPQSEVLQLVFHNLDIVTFTRDYLLATSLNAIIGQIKHVITYFSRKDRKVEYVNLEIQIKSGEKEFLLYVSSASETIDTASSLTDTEMKVIVDSASHGDHVHVKLDTTSTRIEVNKI